MKHFISLLLLLAVSVSSVAQTMSITEFRPDESDMTANTAGTIVIDQNGDKAALIKIETTEFGFSFDTGFLGIVKTVQHTGEIWLYVPEGVKRISISHPRYEKIRDYDLGMTVKKAKTYVMKLNVKKSATDVGGLGTIDVKTIPAGAEVYIDDISVGKTPLAFSKLIPGKHKVVVKKEGYFDYESAVNVTEGKAAVIDESLAKSCDIRRRDGSISITMKDVTFNLIKVEGGTFQMGGTPEQKKAKTDEYPVHRVTLSDYYIGETEVTNELWTAVMGTNPSVNFLQPDQPVNSVTWHDCQKFVNRLSSLTGLRFSLPTEAQWEYAARGGKHSRGYQFAGSDRLKQVGWYEKNSGNVKPVKQLLPNELGLYDMSGNVWEWCADWYGLYKAQPVEDPRGMASGTERVYRGGGAAETETLARVSFRYQNNPNTKVNTLGLRVVMQE